MLAFITLMLMISALLIIGVIISTNIRSRAQTRRSSHHAPHLHDVIFERERPKEEYLQLTYE